jgi:hypothetical protein
VVHPVKESNAEMSNDAFVVRDRPVFLLKPVCAAV